jgi:selenocysteine lyase/cysteine desulfurase
MHRHLDEIGRHGNLHMSDEDEAGFLEDLRRWAGELLGSPADRIAILSSASEMLGQVPLMVPPSGGKVIAVATDFPAVTRPWLRLAGRGECSVQFVDDGPDTDLTDDLIAAIDGETAVVTVGSVQYATGTVIDIGRLQAAVVGTGAILVVDATQAAGALEIDAGAWRADVVVSSGYKWLGGHGGVAVAVLAPEMVERAPALPGWMGASESFGFDATHLRFAADARRFTQSTMAYVSVAGLTRAVEQLVETGVDGIEKHAARLARYLVDAVEPMGWTPYRHLDDPAASPHLVSLGRNREESGGLAARLRAAGIVSSTRGGRLRVSIAPYNNEADIQSLVDALG